MFNTFMSPSVLLDIVQFICYVFDNIIVYIPSKSVCSFSEGVIQKLLPYELKLLPCEFAPLWDVIPFKKLKRSPSNTEHGNSIKAISR